jgi:hypothetical protein
MDAEQGCLEFNYLFVGCHVLSKNKQTINNQLKAATSSSQLFFNKTMIRPERSGPD